MRILLTAFLAAVSVLAPAAAEAADPGEPAPRSGGPRASDPARARRRIRRGSAEEAAQFQRHRLRGERRARWRARAEGAGPARPAGAPAEAAAAPAPAADARPSLDLLRRSAAPNAAAEAPAAQPPQPAAVEYRLDDDAEVAVAVTAPDGSVVRRLDIAPGAEGGRKGANRLEWDGLGEDGMPAPPGDYVAVQTIRYQRAGRAAAETETRVMPLPGRTP